MAVESERLKDLLHGAIVHATCLAMMICAALQLQGEGCYTLQRVACVRSRCYGNIARQVAERVLHDATLKTTTLCNDWCNLSRNDFDHCTACYTVHWSVQLVSQRRCKTSCMKNCTERRFLTQHLLPQRVAQLWTGFEFLQRCCIKTIAMLYVSIFRATGLR